MAAEVLDERWTPLIIRNLLLDNHRFGEIHEGCPRMSTTPLVKLFVRTDVATLVDVSGVGCGSPTR